MTRITITIDTKTRAALIGLIDRAIQASPHLDPPSVSEVIRAAVKDHAKLAGIDLDTKPRKQRGK